MSLAFLLSTAVAKASNGTNLGFVIFIVGWIMQVSERIVHVPSTRFVHRFFGRLTKWLPAAQTVVIFGYPFTPSEIWSIPIVTVLVRLS